MIRGVSLRPKSTCSSRLNVSAFPERILLRFDRFTRVRNLCPRLVDFERLVCRALVVMALYAAFFRFVDHSGGNRGGTILHHLHRAVSGTSAVAAFTANAIDFEGRFGIGDVTAQTLGIVLSGTGTIQLLHHLGGFIAAKNSECFRMTGFHPRFVDVPFGGALVAHCALFGSNQGGSCFSWFFGE